MDLLGFNESAHEAEAVVFQSQLAGGGQPTASWPPDAILSDGTNVSLNPPRGRIVEVHERGVGPSIEKPSADGIRRPSLAPHRFRIGRHQGPVSEERGSHEREFATAAARVVRAFLLLFYVTAHFLATLQSGMLQFRRKRPRKREAPRARQTVPAPNFFDNLMLRSSPGMAVNESQ